MNIDELKDLYDRQLQLHKKIERCLMIYNILISLIVVVLVVFLFLI